MKISMLRILLMRINCLMLLMNSLKIKNSGSVTCIKSMVRKILNNHHNLSLQRRISQETYLDKKTLREKIMMKKRLYLRKPKCNWTRNSTKTQRITTQVMITLSQTLKISGIVKLYRQHWPTRIIILVSSKQQEKLSLRIQFSYTNNSKYLLKVLFQSLRRSMPENLLKNLIHHKFISK